MSDNQQEKISLNLKDISIRLKSLRKETGLIQLKFGEKIGYAQNTVSENENYEGLVKSGKSIAFRYLEKVCEVYNKNIEWLITGSGTDQEKNISAKKDFKITEKYPKAPFGDDRWINKNLSMLENLDKVVEYYKAGLITEEEFIRIKGKIIPKD